MMTLIIGGSGSGKSAYAESCMTGLPSGAPAGEPGEIRKYYIATMQVYDEEGRARIARHRQMRRGKGLITIEQPVSVCDALKKMEPQSAIIGAHTAGNTGVEFEGDAVREAVTAGKKAALLECMSNLVANEMFSGEIPKSCGQVAEKILGDVKLLNEGLAHLVIVTNNVAEDGICYEDTTMEYIRALGMVNERLAAVADKVVEVVVGIPCVISDCG